MGKYTSRKRSTYVPRRRKTSTVRKPYGGSRYGNDAYVKIEAIEPLATAGASKNVFSTMRVSAEQAIPSPGNSYLRDQVEFKAFQDLYARYEVVGMRGEVTLNPRLTLQTANLVGGFAPRMPAIAVFPGPNNNLTYPMQKSCATQGEVTSLYYSYSKDLKNSGQAFAIATPLAYSLENQGMLQFRGVLAGQAQIATIGSIKWTWYVRFHGRTRSVVIGDEPEEPQSQMSYQDLQQQVKDLMSK